MKINMYAFKLGQICGSSKCYTNKGFTLINDVFIIDRIIC